MATYDIANIDPYVVGKVGFVYGVKHTGEALTGDVGTTNKDFIFPSTCSPFMPYVSKADVADETDVIIYVNGTAVTKTAFDPTTRTVTLTDAPASAAVVTGDCVEEQELYIANNLKAPMKFDEKDLPRLRSIDKKKIFTGRTTTITLDFDVADFNALKAVAFEYVTADSAYELRDEPVKCYGYIVLDAKTDDDKDRRIYIPESRAVFTSLVDAKAGDVLGNTMEISIDGKLVLWEET